MKEKEKSAHIVNEYERKLEIEREKATSVSFMSQNTTSSFLSDRDNSDARSYLESAISEQSEQKVASRNRVKAKFRARLQEKQTKKSSHKEKGHVNQNRKKYSQQDTKNRGGEVLFNDINFYEKALEAVK